MKQAYGHEKFPEAINYQLVDNLVALYFAPTIESKENLLNEHRAEKHILVLRDKTQKPEGVRAGTQCISFGKVIFRW